MTDNQYQFMLITGKYYPDDDIEFNIDGGLYLFSRYDNNKKIYYEDSTGYWEKKIYDSKGNFDCTYYENSSGYYATLNKSIIIEIGNHNDR